MTSPTVGPRSSKSPKSSKRSAAPKLDPDVLAALEEQRDFLLRSLTDLDREHDAGDLDDHDHAELRDDYTARAAEVIRAIADQHDAFADAKRPRSLGRTIAWVAGVAVFALISGAMVASALGARKPGESASGGITVRQTASQRANQCLAKMQSAPDSALTCLEKVRKEDPENAVALTWLGWLLSLGAENVADPTDRVQLQALAAVRLDEAVNSDPNYSYARAFRAVVAYRNGRYQKAQEYLDDFKARNPSAQAAQVIEQMDLQAKITAGLQGAGTTTTTTGAFSTTTTTTAAN